MTDSFIDTATEQRTGAPERDARRTVGRHRRPAARTGLAMIVVAAATAAGLALAPTASADPGQGGVTGGNTGQGGVTGGTTGQGGVTRAAPAPAPAPAPEEIPAQTQKYLPGYTPSPTVQEYGFRPYRSSYDTDSYDTSYATPAPTRTAPAPLAPPPPPTVQKKIIRAVQAPPNTILIGGTPVARPDFVDPVLAEQFNNTSQAIQSDGANALVNAGLVDAPQADRIAAGTAAGIITGGATGAAALGAPAAVVGGVGGGLVGAGIGALATTPVVWAGPLGWVFLPGAGALAGAGIGAVALGVPAAIAGAGIGGTAGGLLGATLAGGENATIDAPAPAPAPAPPAVNTTIQAVTTTREAIAQNPAGAQALGTIDTAVATVAAQSAPVIDQVRSVIDAALAALPR